MNKHPDAGELADEFGMTIHYGREDKVADHIHEWAWKPWYEVMKFVCTIKDCNAIMMMTEAERRLNVVERLPDPLRLRVFAEHILEDPPFLLDEASTILTELAAALEQDG